MRRKPDEGIFKVGLAVLNWAKRWGKMRGEYSILSLLTCIVQYDRRVMKGRASVPGDIIKIYM